MAKHYQKVCLLMLIVMASCSSQNSFSELMSLETNTAPKCYDGGELVSVSLDCLPQMEHKAAYELYLVAAKHFRTIEFSHELESWVLKAKYLDIIDALVEKFAAKEPRIKPLEYHYNASDSKEVYDFSQDSYIPLVHYNHLERARDLWLKYSSTKNPKPSLVLPNLRRVLKETIRAEYTELAGLVDMNRLIDMTTRRGKYNVVSKIGSWDRVLRKITKTQKSRYKKLDPQGKEEAIAKFSVSLGITPYEVIPYHGVNQDAAKRYVYRGPLYLFGKPLSDYSDLNDWFKRDLTAHARKDYLVDAAKTENEIWGSALNRSHIIINPADCRLRFEELEPRRINRLQQLTAKILSQKALEKAKQESDDNPLNYNRKYSFNIKELLGRKNDNKPVGLGEVKWDENKKLSNKTLQAGQHELLGAIYRELSRTGAIQVIQRLAPADVHNYVAPANGRALSHMMAAEFLQKRAQEWQEYYSSKNMDGSQKALAAEVEHFEVLKKIFIKQELKLGRPSQSTIDIYGSNLSVSAQAIKNRSNILAQNDRKVMLFLHEGGGFSVHVFIGATGVNKVDVDPSINPKRQGDRTGDMQFGPDEYSEEPPFLKAHGKTTRDGYAKVVAGENIAKGKPLGGFEPDGSTIISLYPKPLFEMLPKVNEYKEWAYYKESKKHTKIEIKSQMGQPILMTSEGFVYKALVDHHITPKSHSGLKSALDAYLKSAKEGAAKVALSKVAEMFTKNLNPYESFFKNKLQELWESGS